MNTRGGDITYPASRFPLKVLYPYLMALPLAGNDWNITKQFGNGSGIQSGRHDQDTQIIFDLTEVQAKS